MDGVVIHMKLGNIVTSTVTRIGVKALRMRNAVHVVVAKQVMIVGATTTLTMMTSLMTTQSAKLSY